MTARDPYPDWKLMMSLLEPMIGQEFGNKILILAVRNCTYIMALADVPTFTDSMARSPPNNVHNVLPLSKECEANFEASSTCVQTLEAASNSSNFNH